MEGAQSAQKRSAYETKPISEWTERDYIECDYDELTDSEIMVLLIMEPGKPVSRTRLRYIALLYDMLYGRKGDV